MTSPRRHFGSDNNSGIHPAMIEAILRANAGHVPAYGDDPYTLQALEVFKRHFGADAQTFFVFNGTAANVLSLGAICESYEAVLCSQAAHINEDECGAPERWVGCKLITVPHEHGKLTPQAIRARIKGVGVQHQVQPRVISISQTTEFGTVYSPDEVRALSALAREHGLLLHMDGARVANAAASLGLSLRQVSRDLGVDVLSCGGTKNGMLAGEAIVVFDPMLANGFVYARKQAMQLASKMRFISAQFIAMLEGDVWLKNASHSNDMAKRLAEGVRGVSGVEISRPVQANAVFARLKPAAIAELQREFHFYVWDEAVSEVRWMTAFDTTEEDVDRFVDAIKACVKA